MAGQAAHVFVSYKAEDRARVQPLVAALEAEGFNVWWDTHIGGGAHWREDIQEHLNAAKCVIVMWTRRSVGPEGDFVRDEAARARKRGSYLPVLLDPVEPPLGFGEVHAISLKGWHGDSSDDRFVELAEAVRECITGVHVARHYRHRDKAGFSRRGAIVGGVGVGVAAAGIGGWLLLKPAPANSKRIAVLPFANLSGDPTQAYFSDGIAEELRSALARIGMEVIGRASSDAVKDLDTKSAASKLDVANILTGSVRRSPETIRVNAQLVSGRDGVEKWAQTYDRTPGDAIKIQTDIAESVAQALSISLDQAGRAALTLGGTNNPAAQDLVLQVRRDTSPGEAGVERRLALLEAALKLDPSYAEAYARQAFWVLAKAAYSQTADAQRRGQTEALALANRAIAIAPNMALGYATRSNIYLTQLQFARALIDARHAMALPGESSDVLDAYAFLLLYIGRSEEALRLNAKGILLDPLSPSTHQDRALILFFSRNFSDAAVSARRSLEIAPDYKSTRVILGNILLAQGKIAEAQAEYRKLDPSDPRWLYSEGLLAAHTGRSSQAQGLLRDLKEHAGDTYHYQIGQIYAQLGMADVALKELELAWDVRDPYLAEIRIDPFLDPLRRDPRLGVLIRQLNFP